MLLMAMPVPELKVCFCGRGLLGVCTGRRRRACHTAMRWGVYLHDVAAAATHIERTAVLGLPEG